MLFFSYRLNLRCRHCVFLFFFFPCGKLTWPNCSSCYCEAFSVSVSCKRAICDTSESCYIILRSTPPGNKGLCGCLTERINIYLESANSTCQASRTSDTMMLTFSLNANSIDPCQSLQKWYIAAAIPSRTPKIFQLECNEGLIIQTYSYIYQYPQSSFPLTLKLGHCSQNRERKKERFALGTEKDGQQKKRSTTFEVASVLSSVVNYLVQSIALS